MHTIRTFRSNNRLILHQTKTENRIHVHHVTYVAHTYRQTSDTCHLQPVAARRVAFPSYPGTAVSIDDWSDSALRPKYLVFDCHIVTRILLNRRPMRERERERERVCAALSVRAGRPLRLR